MTDQEKIDDYDRLKLEYTRLHEDYRRLVGKHETKQLNILDVSNSAFPIYSITEFKLNKIDRIKSLFGSKIHIETIIEVDKEVEIGKTKVNIRVGEDKNDLKITNVS